MKMRRTDSIYNSKELIVDPELTFLSYNQTVNLEFRLEDLLVSPLWFSESVDGLVKCVPLFNCDEIVSSNPSDKVLDGNRGVFGPDGGAAPIVAHPAAGSRRSQGRVAVGHEERIVYHRAGEGGHVDAEAAVGVVLGRVDVAGEGAVGDDERPHAAAPHVHTAAVDGADIPAVALDYAAGHLERADAGLDETVLAGLVELEPFNLEVGARQWILDLQQAVRRVRAVEDG